MRVALGLKAHTGWAALVVLGAPSGEDETTVVDRRRVDLVRESEIAWAKQPYHAAEDLPPAEARRLVRKAIQAAHRNAEREMRAALDRAREAGHVVSACAVLMVEPMPEWSVEEILAVHFRMHKAEGVLFRDALARAAVACGADLVAVGEKTLAAQAGRALGSSPAALAGLLAALGKSVGPPWGKDQKEAATAALIALRGKRR